MTLRAARLLAILLLTSCAQASPLTPGMKAVERIRGREFTHDVKNVTIPRSDLQKYLVEQMQETTPYPLEQWAEVLRALQLVDVPPAQVLPKLLTLYESQVLAFYDPGTHTYYSIDGMPKLPEGAANLIDPETLRETVMVHELTHALQDQLFALSKREKALMADTDANLAYHSVLEGEAVLVMVANMLEKMGIKLDEAIRDDAMRGVINSAAQADSMIDPSTPRYFAELLKFPYLNGLDFVIEGYKRGGWKAVDQLHERPPRSTREILHPAEYFDRKQPPTVELSRPAGAIAAEHLGEFHWRVIVGPDRARGLVSDRAVVFPDGRVEIETKWDSADQASRFATAYTTFLEKRGIKPAVKNEGVIVTASYRSK